MMRAQYDGYGPVSEIDFLGGRWTVLLGPDACGVALQNADKAFASGPGWGQLVGPFFDRGLMLLDFEEHHRAPAADAGGVHPPPAGGLRRGAGPGRRRRPRRLAPGPDFRLYPALKELTLDLATQVFMGGADLASPDELDEVNRAFVACVQAATAIVRLPIPGTRWGRALAGRRLLEDFFGRHLAGKRAEAGRATGARDDLFSVLCGLRDEDGVGPRATRTSSTT